jgi:predicted nucleic acid-binding protein
VTPAAVLVDSNVLLDVLTEDPRWFPWSAEMLASLANETLLAINPIIYAEVSIRFATIEGLEEALTPRSFERLSLPWEAAFLAGKCYLKYRKRGEPRGSPLPDFYIGAHAAVAGMTLLTRDATRYRTYFPKLSLITP